MPRSTISTLAFCAAVISAAVGIACGMFVPLAAWKPALAGLLVALSMTGAAVLVRLARNAPITSPTTFDEVDLKRFFDALESLSKRLLWVFYQVIFAVVVVIASMVVTDDPLSWVSQALDAPLSGSLAALICWLLSRLVAMARGDIGFLTLQRQILERALARERKKAAEKTVNSPVQFKSPGGYGRAVGVD